MIQKPGILSVAVLASLLCGCAGRPIATAPVTTLTARVLATEEITTFTGDVAEVAYSHTLEPAGSPGTTIVAVAWDRCPIADDQERLYALTLERRPIAIGRQAGQSASLESSLAIVSCKAVSSRSVADQQERLMRRIERTVTLPGRAADLRKYRRYYAWREEDETVDAIYVLGGEPAQFWLPHNEMPIILDGGCSVIWFSFNVRRNIASDMSCG
ncbi:MAG TPA: hypothetical protein VF523_06875 [Burkholderiales bacterium]